VAPDGRFLINTVIDSAAAPITLLVNWQGGLSGRVIDTDQAESHHLRHRWAIIRTVRRGR
jgi:hypothetical protein